MEGLGSPGDREEEEGNGWVSSVTGFTSGTSLGAQDCLSFKVRARSLANPPAGG